MGQDLTALPHALQITIDNLEAQVLALNKELQEAHNKSLAAETKAADTVLAMEDAEKQSQEQIASYQKTIAGFRVTIGDLQQETGELQQKLKTMAGPIPTTSATSSNDDEWSKSNVRGFMRLS